MNDALVTGFLGALVGAAVAGVVTLSVHRDEARRADRFRWTVDRRQLYAAVLKGSAEVLGFAAMPPAIEDEGANIDHSLATHQQLWNLDAIFGEIGLVVPYEGSEAIETAAKAFAEAVRAYADSIVKERSAVGKEGDAYDTAREAFVLVARRDLVGPLPTGRLSRFLRPPIKG